MRNLIRAALAVLGCLAIMLGVGCAENNSQTENTAQQLTETVTPPEEPEVPEVPEEPEEPPLTLELIRTITFSDLPGEGNAQDAVRYMVARGVIRGRSENVFDPEGLVDRATVAALIHRMAGEDYPVDSVLLTFTDVAEDTWYAGEVAWAAAAGIAGGYGDGTFHPTQRVSRYELMVMLRRLAGGMGKDTSSTAALEPFRDAAKVGEDQLPDVAWAVKTGLFDPLAADTLDIHLPISREQCARVLTAFLAYAEEEPLAMELAAEDSLPAVESASRLNHETIEAAVSAAAEKYGARGVQVAVIENGRVTDTYAWGWATKDTDPMTAHHRMRIASISKVIIGMETMLLREQGVLDLEDPIGPYWGVDAVNPYYPDHPVTLKTLLTHTSSILNLGDDASRAYDAVKSRLAGGGYSKAIPGHIGYWSYNNYAYGVLGQTVELAAGATMDTLLRRDLLDIMGLDGAFAAGDLKDASDLVTLVRHDGSVARSVDKQRGMHVPATPGATGAYFAGGYTISAADLGELISLLANDGVYRGIRLMDAESVAVMEDYDPAMLGDGSYQGISIRYKEDMYGREGLYFHTGSAYGVYNFASYDPLTGDGVVVLTVGASSVKDDRGIYAICGEISANVYEITK